MNPIICPKCGKINDGTTYFCIYCGTIFEDYKNEDSKTPNVLKIENMSKMNPNGKKYRIIILLGYIFAIFGNLIGVIFAIYLITRKDPLAKKHGIIQLAILLIQILIVVIGILTGVITINDLINYSLINNMTSVENKSTNISNLSNLRYIIIHLV